MLVYRVWSGDSSLVRSGVPLDCEFTVVGGTVSSQWYTLVLPQTVSVARVTSAVHSLQPGGAPAACLFLRSWWFARCSWCCGDADGRRWHCALTAREVNDAHTGRTENQCNAKNALAITGIQCERSK